MNKLNYKFYGNELVYQTLTLAANSGRLCHAYLFVGDDGLGKKTLAKHFAASILCRDKIKPCYSCLSCKKVFDNNHSDFYIYDGKQAKNSIHIDLVRQLRADAYVKPNESDYKVYVIPNANNMTIGAFNALLKVLEEPPQHTIFILTAPNKASVPATILSRCICYTLHSVSNICATDALSQMMSDKSKDEISTAVELSQGNIGRAIDILDNDYYLLCNQTVEQILSGIYSMSEYKVLSSLSSCQLDKSMFMTVIDQLALKLKNSLMAKIFANNNYDDLENKLAFKLTSQQIQKLIDLTILAKENIESNLSVSLVINWICSNIFKILN